MNTLVVEKTACPESLGTIRRNKNPNSRILGHSQKDMRIAQAWLHEEGADPVLVLRSPFGDGRWLTREEYDQIMARAQQGWYAFRYHHGHALIRYPQAGQIGWFRNPVPGWPRIEHSFDGDSWRVNDRRVLKYRMLRTAASSKKDGSLLVEA